MPAYMLISFIYLGKGINLILKMLKFVLVNAIVKNGY